MKHLREFINNINESNIESLIKKYEPDYDYFPDFSINDEDCTNNTYDIINKYFSDNVYCWNEGNAPEELINLINNFDKKDIVEEWEDQNTDQSFTIYKYKNQYILSEEDEYGGCTIVEQDFKF